MKPLYCWRCACVVPMLDEEEYAVVLRLYPEGVRNKHEKDRAKRFEAVLRYYAEITGFEEKNPLAILHHRIDCYGPPCEACGKPYRTAKAAFCAACGHRRPGFSR